MVTPDVRAAVGDYLQAAEEDDAESSQKANKNKGIGKKLCEKKCGVIFSAEQAACGPPIEGAGYQACRDGAKRHHETCKSHC